MVARMVIMDLRLKLNLSVFNLLYYSVPGIAENAPRPPSWIYKDDYRVVPGLWAILNNTTTSIELDWLKLELSQ